MKKIEVKFKRLDEKFNDIELPHYATPASSGMDIRAAVSVPLLIKSGKVAMVPTNLSAEIPEGYEIQVRPRSGLAAKHGIGVLNSPGTIDSDYRGEIKVILFNFSDEHFEIKRGERIAQLVFAEVIKAEVTETETLSDTQRGEGGFGSTGKN
ncbi:MAG: deoxyuridine 5'-triphosphate nucleotidohydrolase [Melioribacteraceae bacterium]|nr:MAG: deoxyuridine 5'-triphosphate nucleotidohydrolase [Melioribacteraceae bacterium]